MSIDKLIVSGRHALEKVIDDTIQKLAKNQMMNTGEPDARRDTK